MMPKDPELNRLLRQWREIEPSPDFAAGVWRRIRAEPASRLYWQDFVFGLRAAMESRLAYAAALAAVVFLWAAVFGSAPGAAGPLQPRLRAFTALHGQTLTGSYAQLMMKGEL